ncbi:MAG: DUF5317 domain-containing protein [Chloroflexi bacterium]|nr:DUF5317 domain-containing protein [Chloroflexota bacterium]
MILLLLLLVALGISLLFGGRLQSLGRVRVRCSYLILIALGIQIVAFSSWWDTVAPWPWLTPLLYALSLALLILTVWLNRATAGFPLLGVGLLLNTAVILANGGHMPASLQALQAAGIATSQAAFEAGRTANSSVMNSSTPLWFLGDIFYVPQPLPLANVFSVGDVFIALGAIWFVVAHTRPTPDAAPAATDD